MFDRVEIVVRGGVGGDGAVSFRREKFVPYGGPDGGDGGGGGSVIVMADPAVTTLRRFETRRVYRAANGGNGAGQRKHGRNGKDLVLAVPVGTVAFHKSPVDKDALIADLNQPGQQVTVAAGGKGGFGNTHYTSSTNQVPRIAQKGAAGEENDIILELRLIADAGIVGFPNAGKSTLLAAASAAKPRIAGYPFTTLEPVLGAVEAAGRTFVLAEIPGLIAGAHLGRGLGHDFLRHVARTKVLIHLIDGSSESPLEDMVRVNAELVLFDSALAGKPQIVAVNKIDLPQVQARVAALKEAFGSAGVTAHFISAETGEGLPALIAETARVLDAIVEQRREGRETAPEKVFRPRPRGAGISVHAEGGVFVVAAPELERLIARSDATSPEVRSQLERQLIRAGVNRALEKAGVKQGDKVRCGSLEWEW